MLLDFVSQNKVAYLSDLLYGIHALCIWNKSWAISELFCHLDPQSINLISRSNSAVFVYAFMLLDFVSQNKVAYLSDLLYGIHALCIWNKSWKSWSLVFFWQTNQKLTSFVLGNRDFRILKTIGNRVEVESAGGCEWRFILKKIVIPNSCFCLLEIPGTDQGPGSVPDLEVEGRKRILDLRLLTPVLPELWVEISFTEITRVSNRFLSGANFLDWKG